MCVSSFLFVPLSVAAQTLLEWQRYIGISELGLTQSAQVLKFFAAECDTPAWQRMGLLIVDIDDGEARGRLPREGEGGCLYSAVFLYNMFCDEGWPFIIGTQHLNAFLEGWSNPGGSACLPRSRPQTVPRYSQASATSRRFKAISTLVRDFRDVDEENVANCVRGRVEMEGKRTTKRLEGAMRKSTHSIYQREDSAAPVHTE